MKQIFKYYFISTKLLQQLFSIFFARNIFSTVPKYIINELKCCFIGSHPLQERRVTHLKLSFACSIHAATFILHVLRYIAHLWRRGKRRLMKRYRVYLYKRQQKREQNLLKEQQQHGHPFRGGAPGPDPNRLPGGKCIVSTCRINLLQRSIFIHMFYLIEFISIATFFYQLFLFVLHFKNKCSK